MIDFYRVLNPTHNLKPIAVARRTLSASSFSAMVANVPLALLRKLFASRKRTESGRSRLETKQSDDLELTAQHRSA
jgi:hypothetical protein